MIHETATIASFSQPGRKHANQDSVFAEELTNGTYLLIIADGMGGHEGGGVASKLAIETAVNCLNVTPNMELDEIFQKIHRQLTLEAEKNEKFSEMGTTLTMCIINRHNAYVGHVGDSRLYLLRNNGLKTVTKDQTEAQKLIDEGVLKQKEAKKYPRRNVLLSVMSPTFDYSLQKIQLPLERNDRLLLLTDGLYDVLSKEEIRDVSLAAPNVSAFCNTLESKARSRDPKDDFSAVCFELLD